MTKYGVILCDPPWEYSNTGVNAAAEKHYPTMSPIDIGNLPVRDIVADDSVLLLWATWPMLGTAIDTMRNWRFGYVTGFPWVKVTSIARSMFTHDLEMQVLYGVGFWARGCSEPLLIGRRGNPDLPTGNMIGLLSPNLHHSKKPNDIYAYAESLEGPYCELFARRKRDGWTSMGFNIDGMDINDALLDAASNLQ